MTKKYRLGGHINTWIYSSIYYDYIILDDWWITHSVFVYVLILIMSLKANLAHCSFIHIDSCIILMFYPFWIVRAREMQICVSHTDYHSHDIWRLISIHDTIQWPCHVIVQYHGYHMSLVVHTQTHGARRSLHYRRGYSHATLVFCEKNPGFSRNWSWPTMTSREKAGTIQSTKQTTILSGRQSSISNCIIQGQPSVFPVDLSSHH